MIKIAIIVPKDTVSTAKLAAEKFEEEITILQGSMAEGVRLAKQLEDLGYDVIIARGGTQILLMQSSINIPILSVPITPVDVFEAINEAEKISEDISLVVSDNMISAIESYIRISGRDFKMFQVKNELEVEQKIKKLAEEGKKVIVGLGIIAKYAPLYGLTPIVIKSGKEAFISTIKEAKRITIATRKEKKGKERIKAIIEHSYEGIICIDKKGYITIFNDSARKLLKYHHNKLIGKKIGFILPELQLEDTLFSGITETEVIKNLKGTKFMISKIPIVVDNEIVNTVAILRDIDEIQKAEEKIRQDIAITGHCAKYTFDDVIGCSEATKETIRIGKEYAKVNSTVLIEGETGTGKEIIAQSIHKHSNRSNKPFVAVNCAALPENLLESELFGYAPGAFTGADRKGKRGLFEQAHTGTIFLDEISEMNQLLQGRLLRVLQEKQVMRVGDNKLIPIDVRVIAATNKNLHTLVSSGKFRDDLYYRLNVLRMKLVPLRNRREDIPYLLNYFIKIYCDKLGKNTMTFSSEATEYLSKYSWPGNVRELRNFCERLTVMTTKTKILLEDITNQVLNIEVNHNKRDKPIDIFRANNNLFEHTLNLDNMEKVNIKLALRDSNGSIMNAAKELGISRTTLWRKMKKYNIQVSR
ncbi:sigma 54-interacting transcriptional regulator [Schnuerera sp. xch1]|uniref:sigma 54-interacting transcriptional regulator n=1 Tax=Schnuerera sp. xch1 TaxID=2874283 RepID=UPI001CC013F1|nr:sigma 54-interacting transcriptional regulator [Schnuerera sp. xch1]MBZ2174130.1 sigma 54-interacting transcriptional regulator [Schnuerera sp. xch1]